MTAGLFWRAFGRSDLMPDQEALSAFLAGHGLVITFPSAPEGWFRAEIAFDENEPLVLERWLADEEGVRTELNAWAGFLETCDYNPHHVALMERCIQTRQLFIVKKPMDCPDEVRADGACERLMQYLAAQTEGVYQADGRGFFSAEGEHLLQEH